MRHGKCVACTSTMHQYWSWFRTLIVELEDSLLRNGGAPEACGPIPKVYQRPAFVRHRIDQRTSIFCSASTSAAVGLATVSGSNLISTY